MTPLSESESRCLACYEQRQAYGCTTEELAELTGMPWNTCNPIRFKLWARNLIVATPMSRRTRNGVLATVYALASAVPDHGQDPEPTDDPVKFGHEEKIRARAALYAVVMRDLELGLDIPPELIALGKWLDAKVLLGARRESEKGG